MKFLPAQQTHEILNRQSRDRYAESNFTPAFAYNQVEYLCLGRFGSLVKLPQWDSSPKGRSGKPRRVSVWSRLRVPGSRRGRRVRARLLEDYGSYDLDTRHLSARTGALCKVRTVQGDSQYNARKCIPWTFARLTFAGFPLAEIHFGVPFIVRHIPGFTAGCQKKEWKRSN